MTVWLVFNTEPREEDHDFGWLEGAFSSELAAQEHGKRVDEHNRDRGDDRVRVLIGPVELDDPLPLEELPGWEGAYYYSAAERVAPAFL